MKPFYTVITDGVSMGSLPFDRDVKIMHGQYKVRAVVNMCRESKGPQGEYRKRGITQLHLPTPDLCSPELYDLILGVRFIIDKRKHLAQDEMVFVHCKGGRGRAATMVLCYLISQGWDANEAIHDMRSKRHVVATSVLHYPAVQQFIDLKKSGELDSLLRASDADLAVWKQENMSEPAWRGSYTMDRDDLHKKTN